MTGLRRRRDRHAGRGRGGGFHHELGRRGRWAVGHASVEYFARLRARARPDQMVGSATSLREESSDSVARGGLQESVSAYCYSMRTGLSKRRAITSQGSPYLLFLVSYTPLACVASCSDLARPMRARSGLAELRGVRAGPSVQNHHLAGFNGASNNIKSLKGCKATTSNYSGATQLTTATQFTSQISNF